MVQGLQLSNMAVSAMTCHFSPASLPHWFSSMGPVYYTLFTFGSGGSTPFRLTVLSSPSARHFAGLCHLVSACSCAAQQLHSHDLRMTIKPISKRWN